MTKEQLWETVLGHLELTAGRGNFPVWFRSSGSITEVNNGVVTVKTQSAMAHSWLNKKYRPIILKSLQNIDPKIKDVKFSAGSEGGEPQAKSPLLKVKKYNRILAQKQKKDVPQKDDVPVIEKTESGAVKETMQEQTINEKYTFDSFIIGSNNEVAHAACKAVSSQPGGLYNPLFIYGGVGLGKTHLMHAIGNQIKQSNPGARVMYVASEKFINDFVQSIKDHKAQDFKNMYRDVDVLIIDDVQFLAGKWKTQEELFHTYNTLYSRGKQIVLSSDRAPKMISTFEDRLRSRLAGGMIVDIQQPSYETRLAILEEKAALSAIKFTPDALAFIAKNIQQNVRELEGALNRVMGYCDLHKKPATLEYTKQILEGILDKQQQKSVDSKKVIEAVSGYYSVSSDDLCGKCRKQNIVRPRQVAMYLLRKENNASFPSIGDFFGGRDHTTAMHACDKIGKLLERDEELSQDINFIRERLYA